MLDIRNREEPSYNWVGMRKWCISYLRIFIAAGESNTESSWDAYSEKIKLLPLEWGAVQKIEDDRVRYIIEVITSP